MALHFVKCHRIAPLHARQQQMWQYLGLRDPRRLHHNKLDIEVVTSIVKDLLNPAGVIAFPDSVRPLYNELEREEILAGLPACDHWGILPEGPIDVDRPNPFAWHVGAAGSSSDDADDEEKEEEKSADEVEHPLLATHQDRVCFRRVAGSSHPTQG